MLDELRSGPATSLILIGIENAPASELARISRTVQSALTASGRFAMVSGGEAALEGPDAQFLMVHRYLLSSATTPEAFAAPALRGRFPAPARRAVLLGRAAGRRARAWPIRRAPCPSSRGSGPGTAGSAPWTACGSPPSGIARSSCAARGRTGSTSPGRTMRRAAIAAAFAAARPGAARLLVSGPGGLRARGGAGDPVRCAAALDRLDAAGRRAADLALPLAARARGDRGAGAARREPRRARRAARSSAWCTASPSPSAW